MSQSPFITCPNCGANVDPVRGQCTYCGWVMEKQQVQSVTPTNYYYRRPLTKFQKIIRISMVFIFMGFFGLQYISDPTLQLIIGSILFFGMLALPVISLITTMIRRKPKQ